jgi:hypothetical protein
MCMRITKDSRYDGPRRGDIAQTQTVPLISIFFSIIFLLTIVGCEPPRDFPPWNRVTRIEVVETKPPRGNLIKEIDDPRQVARIIAFVNANRTGYREPRFGEPRPAIEVNFYDDRQYEGSFRRRSGILRDSSRCHNVPVEIGII